MKTKAQKIYIPIWLDLLSFVMLFKRVPPRHLHSNMVRFIMFSLTHKSSAPYTFTFQYG